MMHLSELMEKSGLFESDTPAPVPSHAAAPTAVHPAAAPTSWPQTTTSEQINPDAADHDEAYQRIAAKSDFASSPVIKMLNKYLAPMADTPIDDKVKFSLAMKQAHTLEGLDPTAVNDVFEQCKATLSTVADSFAQTVASKRATDVDAKKKQADALQAQAKQLSEDAFAADQRLQTAEHKFAGAMQQRLTEVNQEQTKYAALLA